MFSNINDHAKIIAPSYLHNQIRSYLLEEKHGLLNITIISIQAYLKKYCRKKDTSKYHRLFSYYEKLNDLKVSLNIYRNTCCSPTFLVQCEQMINDMKFYRMDPDVLPENDSSQIELKRIVSTLYHIPSNADITIEALDNMKSKDLSDIYIFDAFYNEQEQEIVKILCNQGATLLTQVHNEQQIQFYYAVNMRQEVEALAQYIIEHDLDVQDIAITLGNTSYKALIKQVFERYQIPYTILRQTQPSIVSKRYICFIQYYQEANLFNLMELLQTDVFDIPHMEDLIEYMNIFQCDMKEPYIHLSSIDERMNTISKQEITYLKRLQCHAEEARQELCHIMEGLHATTDIRDALLYIDEIIISSKGISHKMIKKIRQIIQDCVPYLHSIEDVNLLIYFLENVQDNATLDEIQGIIVSDLNNRMMKKPYQFILGCTQKNIPNFDVKKGIFDETYLSYTSYPRLEKRYEYHLLQIHKILHNCDYLILSYPLGTYEGKANEASLDIEEYAQQRAKPYPLITNYQYIPTTFQIEKDSADSLFIKDNTLCGSISAFERYIHCPFSYFLRYGLHLREPFTPGFDQSKLGTLAHFVLEQLVQQYGKDYVHVKTHEIEAILKDEIEQMISVYPNYKKIMNHTKDRLFINIQQNLHHLKEIEEHTHLKPFKTEYEFYHDFTLDEHVNMKLHGFIDRINEGDDYLQIIDYKSSLKTLVENDVFAGLQLQLLTYAIVSQAQFKKKIIGAYYVSLKNENIICDAGKMKRRPIQYIPFTIDEYHQQEIAAHRLHGWNMESDIAYIDDDGKHIVGVTMNSGGTIKARKMYDLDVINKLFQTMYQRIGSSIRSGTIDCTPDEAACTYCKYHEICRFKGFPIKKEVLCEIDDTIYKAT